MSSKVCRTLNALLLVFLFWPAGASKGFRSTIGCFRCTSVNGSNAECEDKFNGYPSLYHHSCMARRPGRSGFFPATHCIKLKLRHPSINNYTIMVRDCVTDNGGTNSESEIGRQTHCGFVGIIRYDEKDFKGCLNTCDSDGCNGAMASVRNLLLMIVAIIATLSQYRLKS